MGAVAQVDPAWGRGLDLIYISPNCDNAGASSPLSVRNLPAMLLSPPLLWLTLLRPMFDFQRQARRTGCQLTR